MLPPLPRLSEYDISPQNGFLPTELPLELLPDPYYEPWESVIRDLQSLILSKRLRQVVDRLPVLSMDLLLTEAEWRRAYSLLGFIAHAYVWGGETPSDVSHPYPRRSRKSNMWLTFRTRSSRRLYPYLSLKPASTLNFRL
jgi:indoleamine 2,3-dioxygenase